MTKSFKKFRAYLADNWRLGLLLSLALCTIAALLFYKLGSLLGGMSFSELLIQKQVAGSTISADSLIRDPLFLPYYLALYLAQFLPFSGPTTLRAVSAVFGFAGALGLFSILKRWYTNRIAIMGTALFATSSWFLFTARTVSPDSSYLLLPLLIAAAVGLRDKQRSKVAFLSILLLGGLLLYVPGVLWFMLFALIIQRKVIRRSFSVIPTWYTVSTLIVGVLLLVPLAVMIAWPPSDQDAAQNIVALLGLPSEIPNFSLILNNLTDVIGQIFLLNPNGPASAVGRLPWLDVGTSILFLIGSVKFAMHYKLDRSKLIVLTAGTAMVLLATGGPVGPIILLPLIYLLVSGGLQWVLDMWLEIFPRNPLARSFGVIMVTLLVFSICAYQAGRYFIAWSNVPETRAMYNKLP